MPQEAWETICYTLPAEQVEEGMSTDDGQDVLYVSRPRDGLVLVDTYTPRPDDPAADAVNRATSEGRLYREGDRVGLAVFEGTWVDGSDYPDAVIRTKCEATTADHGH